MKVKCYGIFKGDQEVLSEYANLSQKSFLSYEMGSAAKKTRSNVGIHAEQTSNGTWYIKQS